MGLDMYLEAKLYISPYEYGNDRDKELREAIQKVLGIEFPKVERDKSFGRVNGVSVRVAYWRKAHEIHQWFVDAVQDGVDNCGTYCVDESHLKDLLEFCKENVDENDPYCEYKQTIEMITPIVEHPAYTRFSFEYSASW